MQLKSNAIQLWLHVAARKYERIRPIKLPARKSLENHTQTPSGWGLLPALYLTGLCLCCSTCLACFPSWMRSGHGRLGPGSLVKSNEGLLLVLLSPRKSCATVSFQNARNSWIFPEEDGWCALNCNTYFQQIRKAVFSTSLEIEMFLPCDHRWIFSHLQFPIILHSSINAKYLKTIMLNSTRQLEFFFLLLMPS